MFLKRAFFCLVNFLDCKWFFVLCFIICYISVTLLPTTLCSYLCSLVAILVVVSSFSKHYLYKCLTKDGNHIYFDKFTKKGFFASFEYFNFYVIYYLSEECKWKIGVMRYADDDFDKSLFRWPETFISKTIRNAFL